VSATELQADLAAVEAEHRAAVAEWEDVKAHEAALARGKIRTPDGRPLSEVDREVSLAAVRAEKPNAAARVQAARLALDAARVGRANELLPELAAEHADKARAAEDALAAVERAWAALVAAAWQLDAAAIEERTAATAARAEAMKAAPDDPARERVKLDAKRAVPLSVGDDGFPDAWRQRPALLAFGGLTSSSDPRSQAFWTNLGRLALDERLARKHLPAATLAAIEQAAKAEEAVAP
jgi:hypothetical protein